MLELPLDVILPYYSEVDVAWPAVESVRAQLSPHWRLVVVDDAYPGQGMAERIAGLGDERIRYIRNDENLGVAGNFERCLKLVDAEYFVMLGDDDLMHPEYVSTIARTITRFRGADVIQPGVRVIDASGQVVLPLADRVKRWLRPSGGLEGVCLQGQEMATSLIRSDWAYFPSLTWRSDMVKSIGFNTDFEVALDYALLLDIALRGGEIVVIEDEVFDYRRHASSVSSQTAASGVRFAQERSFFQRYERLLADRGWDRAAVIARRRTITRLYAAWEGLRALGRFDFRRSTSLWAEAIRR